MLYAPFVHSTEPGICDPPVLLLSFTFGSDRMNHGDRIGRTGAYQGNLVRRPDGSFLCRDFDDRGGLRADADPDAAGATKVDPD